MPTKREYEEWLNSVLGLEIKWSKLSKEELAAIATLFQNPMVLIKRLKNFGLIEDTEETLIQRFAKAATDLAINRLRRWEGPIMQILRRISEET